MSRTPRNVSDSDAREITEFLLDKGIPQNKIASTVEKSQGWVSGVKREKDLVQSAMSAGRQQVQEEIIENLKDKTAQEISKKMLQSKDIPMLTANDD